MIHGLSFETLKILHRFVEVAEQHRGGVHFRSLAEGIERGNGRMHNSEVGNGRLEKVDEAGVVFVGEICGLLIIYSRPLATTAVPVIARADTL